MRTQENKEKYKEYDHKYYIKNRRPKTKIGQLELQIDHLKHQLEEKDKQIDIISRDNNSYKYNIDEQKRIIDDFAKQLKEKDKEIERLKNLFELNNEVVINQGKEMFDLRVQVLQQKQNQTQLAIQELEKVKDFILENTMLETETAAVLTYIYQQIKELKGDKDETQNK